MQVDQSRRDDRAGHVANVGAGIALQARCDPRHFAPRESDIGYGVELLRRVDHAAAAEDEVVSHSGTPVHATVAHCGFALTSSIKACVIAPSGREISSRIEK